MATHSSNLRIAAISAAVTIALSGVITVGFAGASWLSSDDLGRSDDAPAQSAHEMGASGVSSPAQSESSASAEPQVAPEPAPDPEPLPEPEAVPESQPATVDCAVVRCVALTFDDGPDKDVTPRVLNTLKEKRVKATFFQVGRNIGGNEALLRRAIDEGHLLGTHTWDHPQLPLLSAADIEAQILNTKKVSHAATGVMPSLMRPPYGLFNDTVISTVEASHDSLIMWDVDTEDWKNLNPRETTERALNGAHPGAIILLHDVHPSTADALPGIIDGLRAAGYTLVDVPTLLGAAVPGEIYYSGLEPQTSQSGQ